MLSMACTYALCRSIGRVSSSLFLHTSVCAFVLLSLRFACRFDETERYALTRAISIYIINIFACIFISFFFVVSNPHVKCAACIIRICIYVYLFILSMSNKLLLKMLSTSVSLFRRNCAKDDRSPFAIDHTYTSTMHMFQSFRIIIDLVEKKKQSPLASSQSFFSCS